MSGFSRRPSSTSRTSSGRAGRTGSTARSVLASQLRADAAGYLAPVREVLAVRLTEDCGLTRVGLGCSTDTATSSYGPGVWVLLLGESPEC